MLFIFMNIESHSLYCAMCHGHAASGGARLYLQLVRASRSVFRYITGKESCLVVPVGESRLLRGISMVIYLTCDCWCPPPALGHPASGPGAAIQPRTSFSGKLRHVTWLQSAHSHTIYCSANRALASGHIYTTAKTVTNTQRPNRHRMPRA